MRYVRNYTDLRKKLHGTHRRTIVDWRREHVEVFENLIDPPDMAIREKSHPNCFGLRSQKRIVTAVIDEKNV